MRRRIKYEGDGFTGFRVDDDVAVDAVHRRHRACVYRRVSGSRDRRHVIIIGVGEERAAVHQPLEAIVAEQVREALKEVITELVDHQDNHELRSRRSAGRGVARLALRCGSRRHCGDEQTDNKK